MAFPPLLPAAAPLPAPVPAPGGCFANPARKAQWLNLALSISSVAIFAFSVTERCKNNCGSTSEDCRIAIVAISSVSIPIALYAIKVLCC